MTPRSGPSFGARWRMASLVVAATAVTPLLIQILIRPGLEIDLNNGVLLGWPTSSPLSRFITWTSGALAILLGAICFHKGSRPIWAWVPLAVVGLVTLACLIPATQSWTRLTHDGVVMTTGWPVAGVRRYGFDDIDRIRISCGRVRHSRWRIRRPTVHYDVAVRDGTAISTSGVDGSQGASAVSRRLSALAQWDRLVSPSVPRETDTSSTECLAGLDTLDRAAGTTALYLLNRPSS